MRSDEQRGPFGTWLRRARIERGFGNVQGAVRAVQREAGYGIAPSVWAELESGSRRPSDEQRLRLTRYFGSEPPRDAQRATETPDALIAALTAQTAAIAAQTAAIDRLASALAASAPPARDAEDVGVAAIQQFVRELVAQGLLQPPASPRPRSARPSQSRS